MTDHALSYEIRCATADDVDALSSVARRSVDALSVGFYTEAQIAAASMAITTPDLDLIADRSLFAAVAEGRIVGCGGWSKRKKLYTGSDPAEGEGQYLNPACEPARIRAFFVEPDMAGRGIGRAIYMRCAEDAAQKGFSSFELIATLPGVPFYERLGFESAERDEILLVCGVRLPIVRMTTRIPRTLRPVG